VSGPLGINETTDSPESLCPMSALPSLERRRPSLRRRYPSFFALYGLMRQSRHLSSASAYWPRSWSLRRLPPAPAAHGTFSTLFCESFLSCLSPYPGGSAECACLVLPQRHRPSPMRNGSASRFCPRTRLFTDPISVLQLFLHVQASLLASRVVPTATGCPVGQLRLLHPS